MLSLSAFKHVKTTTGEEDEQLVISPSNFTRGGATFLKEEIIFSNLAKIATDVTKRAKMLLLQMLFPL